MFSKVVIALAFFAVAQAGEEPPPPKTHTYNVPSVSKVSYPGPTVHKSVETYSAPSIEKTTTITRTITAPLNAPAVRHISYSAPSAPIVAAAPVAYGTAPVAVGGYAAPAHAHGHGHAHGYAGYAAPALEHGFAGYAAFAGPAAYGGGIGLQTTYSAPALGYSLGGPGVGYAAAPAPVLAAEPVAYAAPAVAKGGYDAPAVKEVKGGY